MHLAPGRSAWCLAQSNTNSGHGIPSKALTASEHSCRSPQQPRDAVKVANTGLRKARCRQNLPDGVTARLVGVELRRDRRRIWGLHGMRYPLHSFLNRAQGEEILSAHWDSRSRRNYINHEFVTRPTSVWRGRGRLRSQPVWRANPEQTQACRERYSHRVSEAQPERAA